MKRKTSHTMPTTCPFRVRRRGRLSPCGQPTYGNALCYYHAKTDAGLIDHGSIEPPVQKTSNRHHQNDMEVRTVSLHAIDIEHIETLPVSGSRGRGKGSGSPLTVAASGFSTRRDWGNPTARVRLPLDKITAVYVIGDQEVRVARFDTGYGAWNGAWAGIGGAGKPPASRVRVSLGADWPQPAFVQDNCRWCGVFALIRQMPSGNGICASCWNDSKAKESSRLRRPTPDDPGVQIRSTHDTWNDPTFEQAVPLYRLDLFLDETLNSADRKLWDLWWVQRISYQEISDRLGAPIGTVKSKLSRLKSKIRAAWNKHRDL